MIRSEAVALIHQQLNFRSDQADNIITYLKLAQQELELEPELPWFLTSETLTTTTTPGEPRVGVPPGMLEEFDSSALFYLPSTGELAGQLLDLKKGQYDDLVEAYRQFNYVENPQAYPRTYALRGNYFVLFPTPMEEYTIKINIYAADTVLTSDVENGWLKNAPLLLMGKAIQYISSALGNPGAQATGKDWERQGRLALTARNTSREVANMRPQMGGRHY